MPNNQPVTWDPEAPPVDRAVLERNTELTAWFQLNGINEEARGLLFYEIPQYFRFNKKERTWSRFAHNHVTDTIGRL